MKTYCAWCGTPRPADDTPCPSCGRTGTTTTPPSQEPCAYCGARPTWPVTWGVGEQATTVYLCAFCDHEEVEYLERD